MNLVTIVRVLGLLLIARFLMSFLKHLVAGYKGAAPARSASGNDLVRDRVCNTFLPRERAIHALVNGHEEHFCSTACRDRARELQPAH
jgi:hypothetical protein